jgi:hypothetical protein
MYSKKHPDAVVVIVASPVVIGHRRRRHPRMLYVPSSRNIVNAQGVSLSNLMMQLVVAPEPAGDGTPLVMLKHYSQYICVTEKGALWSQSSPGVGGYWMVHPSFPAHIMNALPKLQGTMVSLSYALSACLVSVGIAAILAILPSMID